MNKETQIYGVVLPRETAQKARVAAASLGTSRSRLMRDLLIEFLNSNGWNVQPTSPSPIQPVVPEKMA